jgi:hypothetical protein
MTVTIAILELMNDTTNDQDMKKTMALGNGFHGRTKWQVKFIVWIS